MCCYIIEIYFFDFCKDFCQIVKKIVIYPNENGRNVEPEPEHKDLKTEF
jgi:hypothetical protein